MKKIVLVSFICVTIIFVVNLIVSNNEKVIIENTKSSNLKVNSNALTMMYEIEADSGEYQISSDSVWPQEGYTFNETLSKCENGSTLTWNEENKKVLMQANTSDRCYVYFDVYTPPTLADVCPDGGNFAECIEMFYDTYGEGVEGLYYHDGTGTYGTLEAGDNSYRYTGENPNNYVCFGSDEETCPTDNLYRIIGVFDGQVKLIKADYTTSAMLGTDGDFYNASYSGTLGESSYYKGSKDQSSIPIYYWNINGTNTWSESQLNTVNLNTNYLNSLGSEWSDKIATTEWQVGGATYSNVYMAPETKTYNYEV